MVVVVVVVVVMVMGVVVMVMGVVRVVLRSSMAVVGVLWYFISIVVL